MQTTRQTPFEDDILLETPQGLKPGIFPVSFGMTEVMR
jgi:hypothetical protein